jgi:ABC-type sugar transport system permease subunit
LLYSFYLTFQNYDLAIGPPAEYVALENYEEMLADTRFWRSWINTFIIIFPAITLQLLLGLGITLLLNRPIKGRAFITRLLIIPSMVSPVSAAMVWRMLYGVKYGGINNALIQAGILDVYFDWFATPARAIFSIVVVEVWHNTSFMMIVLLAGLQSIPQELYEAGEVDGASPWQRFCYITLPLRRTFLGDLEVLQSQGCHCARARACVFTRTESEDCNGLEDDHGSLAQLPFHLGEIPLGLPRCR